MRRMISVIITIFVASMVVYGAVYSLNMSMKEKLNVTLFGSALERASYVAFATGAVGGIAEPAENDDLAPGIGCVTEEKDAVLLCEWRSTLKKIEEYEKWKIILLESGKGPYLSQYEDISSDLFTGINDDCLVSVCDR